MMGAAYVRRMLDNKLDWQVNFEFIWESLVARDCLSRHSLCKVQIGRNQLIVDDRALDCHYNALLTLTLTKLSAPQFL